MEVIGKRNYSKSFIRKAFLVFSVLAFIAFLMLAGGLSGILTSDPGEENVISFVLLGTGGIMLVLCLIVIISLIYRIKSTPISDELVFIDSENIYLAKRNYNITIPIADIIDVKAIKQWAYRKQNYYSWGTLIIHTENKKKYMQLSVADVDDVSNLIIDKTNALNGYSEED